MDGRVCRGWPRYRMASQAEKEPDLFSLSIGPSSPSPISEHSEPIYSDRLKIAAEMDAKEVRKAL